MASEIKILFENIIEAIFCSIFLLNTKRKNKTKAKIVYICLNLILYIILKNYLKFNILFQVLYMIGSYFISNLIFRKQSNIIDLIMILMSYLFLILESAITYFTLYNFIGYMPTLIIARILLFILFFILKNEIYKLYDFLIKGWNRKTNKTKIRSLTIRNICIIGINLIFLIIFIWLSFI